MAMKKHEGFHRHVLDWLRVVMFGNYGNGYGIVKNLIKKPIENPSGFKWCPCRY